MNEKIKHLDLNTPDGAQLNLDALYRIAPSVFTEGRDKNMHLLKFDDNHRKYLLYHQENCFIG